MKTINLGKVIKIKTGKLNANQANEKGKYPFFTCATNTLRIDEYAYDCECALVAGNGDLNVKYYNGKFNAYQRVYIIESIDKEHYNVKFLYYFLQSYIEILRKNSIGGVIKYIKLQDLTNAKLPDINIERQLEIVQLLENSKKIILKRQQQIEDLSKLKQSIFLDMFGNPSTNPKRWKEDDLGNYLCNIKGGWSPKCHSREAIGEEWGVLKLSALTQGDYNFKYNKALPQQINPKTELEVRDNDLLFNRKNTPELVGTTAFVYKTRGNLIYPDTVFRLELKDGLNKIFLWKLLSNTYYREKVKQLASGSAKSMSNISQKNLKQLKIIIPTLPYQEQYAKKVREIDNQIRLFLEGLSQMKMLYDSILYKAFKDELF